VKYKWLITYIFFIFLGSSTATIEVLITNSIDSILPNVDRIKDFNQLGSITFLSTNKKIIQKIGPSTRKKLESGQIPENIEKAFISAEDRRFYRHHGVDFIGIIRALITNFKNNELIEGASTINQQLARIVFLNQNKTISRKIKEAALALKIDRNFSKKEILEHYLNNVYLGSSAYGITDAAWIYFSKTPSQLNLEEAALIAGLAPAPSIYSPLINPDLAIKRRNIVLDRMNKENYISQDELEKSKNTSLNLRPEIPKFLKSSAPFFTSWCYQQLSKVLSNEQLEVGGLKVLTSLNDEWQLAAKEVISNYSAKGIEGAIVSIQPSTGLVRALVGGKDFKKNQFNRVTQAIRSPGSTFKIFVYASALTNGIKAENTFNDLPKCWENYCPKNFNNKYLGKISLVKAFTSSSNIVAVELLDKLGFDNVITTANSLGVGKNQKLEKYLPLAVGAYGETLLNMTSAYAAIANRGMYISPNPIEKIIGPNNKVLWSYEQKNESKQQVLPKGIADTLNWMLEQAVRNGTGSAASLPTRSVAGKTGTSDGNRDLWFIGSLPQLTTGVWFGNDNNKETLMNSGNAAWVWKKYTQKIEKDLKVISFPTPKNF
tara:strand:- start:1603 stop:3408 length:1806 start_codon:yes stop_codon:yes gene_type:complete